MEQQIRVLIADDQRPVRPGLRALAPKVDVVAEAADGRAAVHLVAEHQPDVVVMDMQMPVMDGLEATRYIKGQWPEVCVLDLSMSPWHRPNAFAARVDAFPVKGCPTRALEDAILNRKGYYP